MQKYCYVVYEDGIEVAVSKLFDTPEAAMKYFLTEDAPLHYKNETFYRGEIFSFLTNSRVGKQFTKGKRIRIEFTEAVLNPLHIKAWENISKDFSDKRFY